MRLAKIWHDFMHGKEDDRETEFLPGILEVTETPPSPVGRAVLWSLAALLSIGFLWAYFSMSMRGIRSSC